MSEQRIFVKSKWVLDGELRKFNQRTQQNLVKNEEFVSNTGSREDMLYE